MPTDFPGHLLGAMLATSGWDRPSSMLVAGIVTGAIYAVAASGLVVTYTTSGIFNLAHGAVGMLGAFSFWTLHVAWGWPLPVALVLVLLVLAPAFGLALERVVFRGLQGAGDVTRLVVSAGVLASCIGLAQIVWPPDRGRFFGGFFPGSRVELAGVQVTGHQLTTIGVAIMVAALLRIVLVGTRTGVAMRAVVDDRELAQLNGARPDRIAGLAWAMGCSLAALSGILIADVLGLQVHALTLLVVNAYAAAIFGRLVSLPLTFLGAIVLGVLTSFVTGYQGELLEFARLVRSDGTLVGDLELGSLATAVPVLLLFVMLLVLPQERLRAHSAHRARERAPVPRLGPAAVGMALLIGVAIVAAGSWSDTDLRLGARALALAIIMLSLVPLTGYGGQISLAQLSFAGIGAVAMSHHGVDGSLLGLLAAIVFAGLAGALVALPALRLHGIYLALATMAFAVFMERLVFRQRSVFAGGSLRVERPRIGSLDLASEGAYLVFMAVVFSCLGLLVVALRRGPFGRRLVAMKDSPAACATLGIDLTRMKLQVFVLSAAMAGLGGALLGGARGNVSAQEFDMLLGLPILLMAVAGGISLVAGALFGGLVYGSFPWLTQNVPASANVLLLTPGLVGIALGRDPDGAVAGIARVLHKLPGRQPGEAAGSTTGQGAEDHRAPQLSAPAEILGLTAPFVKNDLAALDEALGLDEVGCR